MSTNNGGWKPRKTEMLTCPSGQVVTVRRPGPEFALRAGRVTRTFTASLSKEKQDDNSEDTKTKGVEEMSDEELATVVVFARELVCAMLVSPKLVLEPRVGFDEVGPDDIGNDFWFLFNYGMTNFYNIQVPVGNEEVKVSDLETFRTDDSVSGDSVDGPHIPPDAEQSSGDRGLGNSAGA